MLPQELSEVKLLGAAINGILAALLNRDALLADFNRRHEIQNIPSDGYHPISLYLEFCDYLEARLGVYAFLRLGRKVGSAVMDATFPPGLKDVEAAVSQIDIAHRIFCRPVIGAFEIMARKPGMLTVRNTAPYNCTLQEGLFYEVAIRYGAPNASVHHAACRRKGADACRYEIKY